MDPSLVNLTKAIALTESGSGDKPNYDAVGDNGTSHGAYQWQPGNFAAAASAAGLDPKDFSPTNQNKVAYSQVKALHDKGFNPAQIAASWNAGEHAAQTGSWQTNVGTTTINGKPISYDTPSYVRKVSANYIKLSGAGNAPQQSSGGLPQAPEAPQPIQSAQDDLAGTTQAPAQGNLTSDLNGRTADLGTAISDTASGKINPVSGVLQGVGAVAGGLGDIAHRGLELIPGVKSAEGLIGQGVSAAANTDAGKAIIGAGTVAANAHPELAKDIGAVGNIAGVAGMFTGAGAVKEAIGGALGKDSLAATIDAISPEIKAGTAKGATDVGKNGVTKSGMFGTVSRVEDPAMREAAPVILDNIPKFDKLGTNTEMLNAIEDKAIPNEANTLVKRLQEPDVQTILSPDMYNNFLQGVKTSIEESPSLIGDSGEYAKRFLGVFEKNLPQGTDATALDVLKARQALDQAAKAAKPKVFDAATTNAYADGLDAVRSAANKLIGEMAPDAQVAESLRRQSLLYRAAKNLTVKADKEVGSNKFSRFAGRHPKTSGLIKYAGKAALGGVGLGVASDLLGSKQ